MTNQPIGPAVSPNDSTEALEQALSDTKLHAAQLKGWLAFARLRDGVKAPKAARKTRGARTARETPAANGAVGAASEHTVYPRTLDDGATA